MVEEAKSQGTKVIMSSHFFETTPPLKEMVAILNECTDKGADIAKLAVMPQKPEDILELFHAALQARGEVCVIAMGDLGRHSRVIACRYGSLLTYGCVEKPVAPGQIRIDQLKRALETIV
jgi:3-dehydroquinate dehydratase-1